MNEFVAHDYLEEGVWEFLKCIQPDQIVSCSRIDHFVLIAEMEDQIIGTIEIREYNHISLFCVEKQYRQRGVGRKLLQRALNFCLKHNPNLSEITVNTLPSSVHIYKRLGFHSEKSEAMEREIPYTPMFLVLSQVENFQPLSSDACEFLLDMSFLYDGGNISRADLTNS
ncbi:MAG: GNAT family N-acetyltransferase [Deltaproteobacteria bacterium]|nr:GNAT family N-acetyltransferase [Deltaproteobacteria bacterium]